jgi:serpin B
MLAENYGAGLRILNFAEAPEECRITINNWVDDQTEGRIKDLIPQGLIDQLTRLVLTNAIYFNAAWASPFNEGATSDGAFHLLNGDEVIVPTMRQTESFGHAESDDYQAIELPYDGNELSMVILLPGSGEFNTFDSSLNSQKLDEILGELEYKQVDLTMPKFEFETSFALKDTLSEMGMPVAFSGDADFSGMTGNRELSITAVVHKAFVSVDEAGTEAAAATAVIVGETSAPAEPIEVKIDRPFIFLIRDIETGSLLFVGRVLNPAS